MQRAGKRWLLSWTCFKTYPRTQMACSPLQARSCPELLLPCLQHQAHLSSSSPDALRPTQLSKAAGTAVQVTAGRLLLPRCGTHYQPGQLPAPKSQSLPLWQGWAGRLAAHCQLQPDADSLQSCVNGRVDRHIPARPMPPSSIAQHNCQHDCLQRTSERQKTQPMRPLHHSKQSKQAAQTIGQAGLDYFECANHGEASKPGPLQLVHCWWCSSYAGMA